VTVDQAATSDGAQEAADRRAVRLDSAKLRVLAHPLRARLLAALRAYGPSTATALAQRLSTNSGATSYHLRQLAAVGLIEEEPERGTARQRWWRAAHELTNWSDTQFIDDPDDRAAAEWLTGHNLRQTTRWREDWLESRDQWPREWRDAADRSDLQLELTPEQLRAMNVELLAVVERYRRAGPTRQADAERIIVLLESFPSPEPRL
jgi:DNA-binding transcriptional ArsR family regulator